MQEKIKDGLRAFVVPLQVLEDESLSVYEKMVYVVLRSFVNPHKAEAWPSIQTICRMSGVSRRQVIRTLKSLEEKGYIAKQSNYVYDPNTRKARQTANIYTLDLPGGVPDRHPPRASQTPPPCLTDTPPGVSQAPKHINDEQINMNNDDDRHSIIESVWEKVKEEISREEFDQIVKRSTGRKVSNLSAYIMKSIQTHITNQAAAAASENTDKPQRRRSKKDLPLVSDDATPAREMSDEEIRHMYELARKLKERGKGQ